MKCKRIEKLFVLAFLVACLCGCGGREASNITERLETTGLASENMENSGDMEDAANVELIEEEERENINEYEVREVGTSYNSDVLNCGVYDQETGDIVYYIIDKEGNVVKRIDDAGECSPFYNNLTVISCDENKAFDLYGNDVTACYAGENEQIIDMYYVNDEVVMLLAEIRESYDALSVSMIAKNAAGEVVGRWEEEQFKDMFLKRLLSQNDGGIEYIGDGKIHLSGLTRENEHVDYVIDLFYDSYIFEILNDTQYYNYNGTIIAYDNKVIVDGICYDENYNIVWADAVIMAMCANGGKLYWKEGCDLFSCDDVIVDGMYMAIDSTTYMDLNGNDIFNTDLLRNKLYSFYFYEEIPYAVGSLHNSENKPFFGVLDRNGNWVFEPKKGQLDYAEINLLRYNLFSAWDENWNLILYNFDGTIFDELGYNASVKTVVDDKIYYILDDKMYIYDLSDK